MPRGGGDGAACRPGACLAGRVLGTCKWSEAGTTATAAAGQRRHRTAQLAPPHPLEDDEEAEVAEQGVEEDDLRRDGGRGVQCWVPKGPGAPSPCTSTQTTRCCPIHGLPVHSSTTTHACTRGTQGSQGAHPTLTQSPNPHLPACGVDRPCPWLSIALLSTPTTLAHHHQHTVSLYQHSTHQQSTQALHKRPQMKWPAHPSVHSSVHTHSSVHSSVHALWRRPPVG